MTEPVFPVNISSSRVEGARLDPKLCPHNSQLLAFINQGDIWVANIEDNQECRLTYTNAGNRQLQVTNTGNRLTQVTNTGNRLTKVTNTGNRLTQVTDSYK